MFFTRISSALKEVDDRYDVVVIDCPPQLGYLTLTALTASTSVLITVHPQMLEIMSMSQFLLMLGVSSSRSKAPARGSSSIGFAIL
jgi:chromosome partitioning protein